MEAEAIKRLIKDQGHTYRSLGEVIGMSAQGVSEIVNGRTKSKTSRFALACALGVSLTFLWPEYSATYDRAA
jgi:transcriptional regulator with XRE-family HTH domain